MVSAIHSLYNRDQNTKITKNRFTQNIMIHESRLIQLFIHRSRISKKIHSHAREKNLNIGITNHE